MEATCRNKLACMPDHCFCVDRSVNDEHVALNVLTGRGSQSDSCDTRLTPSCQEGTHHSATSELVTEIKNLAEAKANSHTSLQSNATMKLKSHGEPFGQLHRKFRWSLRSPDNAAAVSLSHATLAVLVARSSLLKRPRLYCLAIALVLRSLAGDEPCW
jgi:hypothetical protein